MTEQTTHTRRRRAVGFVVAVSIVVFGVAGGAYAYWRTTGSGGGSGKVGSAVTVTVNAATGTGVLHPGASGPAYFTLNNTNPFGATFNQVNAATVVSNDTAHCASSNVSITPTSFPYTFSPAVTVSGNTTSGTLSIPGLVTLSSASPNGCEGVTFNVTLTLSGTST